MKKNITLLVLFTALHLGAQSFVISTNFTGLLSYKKVLTRTIIQSPLSCSNATEIHNDGNIIRYMSNSNDDSSVFCGISTSIYGNSSFTDWNNVLYSHASIINDLANNLSLQIGTYSVALNFYNDNILFFTPLNLNGKTYVYDSGSTPIKYITFINFPGSLSDVDFVKTNLTLYPNPVQNVLNIDINQEFSGCIYDLTGKKLLNFSTKTVDISELTSGVYLLDIISEDKRYTKKIIKQ